MDELRVRIIEGGIDAFSMKGLKFTMDDVAQGLHISKKTVYTVFPSKEDLLLGIADYSFAAIKESEHRIAQDESLDIIEKIKRIMVVLPERYQNIGLSNLYLLNEKYPNVYRQVERNLSTDWDVTISLLRQAMDAGRIRPISIPILKAMFEGTLQSFLRTNVLIANGITYEDALHEVIETIMGGIILKGENS